LPKIQKSLLCCKTKKAGKLKTIIRFYKYNSSELKLFYLRPDLPDEEVLLLLLPSPDERLLLPELLELTADLDWLWPEELLELTDRGAGEDLETFLDVL